MSETATSEKSAIDTFLERFVAINDPEERLKSGVAFMRTSLSEGSSPYFKGFWEIRKRCLPLFKEAKVGPARAQLWEQYIELTREGRRLKHLLDEETAFAVEQIDLAIIALEKEINTPSTAPPPVLPQSQALEKQVGLYQEVAAVLAHLNTFAVKISALRKELIHQQMRVRQKNQFFERLSKLGDAVFPVRKQKINDISIQFVSDVDAFVAKYFAEESFSRDEARGHVFFLREEIKALQAVAKILTLNTTAFTKTRERLSACWDQLKGLDKEFKKEAAAHREKSSINAKSVREKMELFSKEEWTEAQAAEELDAIALFMRDVLLTRDDVRALKDELNALWRPFAEKKQAEEEKNKEERAAKEKQRKQAFFALRTEIDSLKQLPALINAEQQLDETLEKVTNADLTSQERQELKRALKRLAELLAEEKEKALLESLSDSDRASIGKLEDILSNRRIQKKKIKAHVDELRKQTGSSGQDFEKAMTLSQKMEEEKQRLNEVEKAILEIEQKLASIKSSS